MPAQPTDGLHGVEHRIVVEVLARQRTATAELYARIRGVTPEQIDDAISALVNAGVIRRSPRGTLSTGATLRHLDGLGLIAI